MLRPIVGVFGCPGGNGMAFLGRTDAARTRSATLVCTSSLQRSASWLPRLGCCASGTALLSLVPLFFCWSFLERKDCVEIGDKSLAGKRRRVLLSQWETSERIGAEGGRTRCLLPSLRRMGKRGKGGAALRRTRLLRSDALERVRVLEQVRMSQLWSETQDVVLYQYLAVPEQCNRELARVFGGESGIPSNNLSRDFVNRW
ncbi:hypothetical protein B0H14DRAFT_2575685 [Mycena olivaceomarginata]|nr:hypothetical protein B0H14DRAFT_2575685 [Mycena olivaceomarginata]